MAKKNTAEVLINGKVYTVSGYESTEYLQKIANYLNQMEEKISETSSYQHLPPEQRLLLKDMNLADEFFKADQARERLEQEAESKDKEIYELKHDLIDAKMREEALLKEIEALKAQIIEEQRKRIRLSQSAMNRRLVKPEERL